MLNSDGHVLLVDLGGVLDQEGKVLGKNTAQNNIISPLFAQRYDVGVTALQGPDAEADSPSQSPEERNKRNRRMSIMGTFGYMVIHTLSYTVYIVKLTHRLYVINVHRRPRW